jgi:hypothetical protein
MPAISPHTDQEWQRARDLVASGMEMPEVSERTGIPYEGLRKRAQREEWLVPSSAVSLAKSGLSPSKQDDCPKIVPSELILAESIAETGQKGAKYVVEGLIEVIRRTFNPSSPLMLKEIESHKEAASMFGMFAKASGLDKPQQAVQINMWGQASGTISGPDIPLDCTQIDSDASQGP